MSQFSFFDEDKRLTARSAKGDPQLGISLLAPWEMLPGDIEAVVVVADETRKSNGGRKPLDALVLFRMMVLPFLFDLSDEQAEYLVRDRCRSRTFSDLASRTAFRRARRYGCSARSSPSLTRPPRPRPWCFTRR